MSLITMEITPSGKKKGGSTIGFVKIEVLQIIQESQWKLNKPRPKTSNREVVTTHRFDHVAICKVTCGHEILIEHFDWDWLYIELAEGYYRVID